MSRKYMTPTEKLNLRKNFEELFGHEDPTKLCQSDRDAFCNTYHSNLGQHVKPYQKIALIRYMHAWVTQISDLSEYRRAIDHAIEGARVERNRKERERKAKAKAKNRALNEETKLKAQFGDDYPVIKKNLDFFKGCENRLKQEPATAKPPATSAAKPPSKFYIIVLGWVESYQEACMARDLLCLSADSSNLKEQLLSKAAIAANGGCTLFQLQDRSPENPTGEPKRIPFKINEQVTYDLVLG